MAEGDENQDQKTEQPTAKRLEEARKRGQLPFSREVSNFLILLTLTLSIVAYFPYMMRRTAGLLMPLLADAQDFPIDNGGMRLLLTHLMTQSLSIVIVPLMAAATAALAASVLQNGIVISIEPIIPKWEKVSLSRGLERMFSLRSVVEFAKGVLKIGIVGAVSYMAVQSELPKIRHLEDVGTLAMLLFLAHLATKLMAGVCVAVFFIALFDLIYQRLDYVKKLRMSRQELKDEYKQQEGDPMVKRRLRQIRTERARKRMMAAVPKADVVITNPTHFAVALQYENKAMQAPKVVAKGQDNIALTMRRIAEENDVPIVENPPLARALFDTVEIDQEIPVDHYKAVAEIISYVWKLKGKMPKQAGKRL